MTPNCAGPATALCVQYRPPRGPPKVPATASCPLPVPAFRPRFPVPNARLTISPGFGVIAGMTASDDAPLDLRSDWSGPVPPPRKWICDGWLLPRLTLFAGHGGVGKSRVALQLAAAVASNENRTWIPSPKGRRSHPLLVPKAGKPVLVVSWEDEADEVHRRLNRMADSLPWADPKRIEDRLHFADLAGRGPLWNPQRNGCNALTGVGKALRAAAEQIEARLLIIDPRAAAYAGDENHRAQVRAFIAHWDRWAREQECAVLLVDHLPKSSKTRRPLNEESTYAGSTDWYNAARCVWNLDDKQILRCKKSNYGATPHPVQLSSKDGCVWTGVTNRNFSESGDPQEPAHNPYGAD